jgi:hypothetical protein
LHRSSYVDSITRYDVSGLRRGVRRNAANGDRPVFLDRPIERREIVASCDDLDVRLRLEQAQLR